MVNDMPNMNALRALLRDIQGATADNKSLLKLINPVRAAIDAVRQDFRETVPEELAKRFNKKPTRSQWTQMFDGLARTDLMAFGRGEAMKMLKSKAVADKKVRELEEKVTSLGGKFGTRYLEKAEALATYMMSQEKVSNHMQRNAHAIAHMFGEKGKPKKNQVTPDLIQAIDELTTLYAFQKTDDVTRETLSDLVQNEEAGMRAVIGTLQAARTKETTRKSSNDTDAAVAINNAWKGYAPSLVAQGSSVIIEDDVREADLLKKGYVRIGTYKGDRRENFKGKRGYYQSTVGGKSAFRQGIAQTVHESYQGVDTKNGRTQSPETQGVVLGSEAAAIAKHTLDNGANNNLAPGEYLLPLFDAGGNTVGYEIGPQMGINAPGLHPVACF